MYMALSFYHFDSLDFNFVTRPAVTKEKMLISKNYHLNAGTVIIIHVLDIWTQVKLRCNTECSLIQPDNLHTRHHKDFSEDS